MRREIGTGSRHNELGKQIEIITVNWTEGGKAR